MTHGRNACVRASNDFAISLVHCRSQTDRCSIELLAYARNIERRTLATSGRQIEQIWQPA